MGDIGLPEMRGFRLASPLTLTPTYLHSKRLNGLMITELFTSFSRNLTKIFKQSG